MLLDSTVHSHNSQEGYLQKATHISFSFNSFSQTDNRKELSLDSSYLASIPMICAIIFFRGIWEVTTFSDNVKAKNVDIIP